jgi:hypothetical protein
MFFIQDQIISRPAPLLSSSGLARDVLKPRLEIFRGDKAKLTHERFFNQRSEKAASYP